jgi:hypothetical protein
MTRGARSWLLLAGGTAYSFSASDLPLSEEYFDGACAAPYGEGPVVTQ